MKAPFKKDDMLSGGSLETLRDWLDKNANRQTVLAGDYTVANLIDDLERMLDGMWSDGVDAMGEDA